MHPTPEQQQNPEVLPVAEWIQQVERAQQQNNVFSADRTPGTRAGTCLSTSDLIALCAERSGHQAQRTNIKTLNALRGIPPAQSFTHEICIIDRTTLIDLTLCQFINPETGEIQTVRNGDTILSGYNGTDTLVQELLAKGYTVIQTEEELAQYLDRFTDHAGTPQPLPADVQEQLPPFAPSVLRRERLEYTMGYRFDTPLQDQVKRDIEGGE